MGGRHGALLKCAAVIAGLLVMSNIIVSSPISPTLFTKIQPPLIDDKFKLTTHIKSGGYGAVYSGYSILDHTPIAAKLESMDESSKLKNEYELMLKAQTIAGIPKVYCRNEYSDSIYGRYHVMVMEKLGKSVKSLISDEASGLPEAQRVKNLLVFAVQALQRLEALHDLGILHNDIKPGNFLLGTESKNQTVYLIDFGIASLYERRGVHVIYTDGHSSTGTPGLQSFHNLIGEALSRRDDLESLGYCLLTLHPNTELPWSHVVNDDNEKSQATLGIMLETRVSDLCSGLPPEFCNYFRHVKSLGFYERPNYKYLQRLFETLYERKYGAYSEARLMYKA